MTIDITSISVNNESFDQVPVDVRLGPATINWSFSTPNPAIVQGFVEVRLGSHSVNWGNDDYSPDIFKQPLTKTKATSWRLAAKYLSRGNTYYGQVRVKDSLENLSDWKLFSFTVNAIPFIRLATLSPAVPSVNDDLSLSYASIQDATAFSIRWFKNGVHQSQFDDFTAISKDYLRYLDSWQAEVTPRDSLENGRTVSSNAVTISKLPPEASELQILPVKPTEQDILEADYSANDPNTGTLLMNDKSIVKWFVNGAEIENASGYKFVRLNLQPTDEVWFTLTPSDGNFSGSTVVSPVAVIEDAGFRIINLKVDGLTENISVKTVNPTVEWTILEPLNRSSRYAQIKIGTAPGSSNIYSTIIETFEEKFVVPDNTVERGVDYYITVSASDEIDTFPNFVTTHFRIAGSLWESKVSNSVGWTIEAAVRVSVADAEATGFQRISIGDGTAFAELRIFPARLDLMLGSSNVKTYDIDMTIMRTLVITGKGDDIKVFSTNDLILDGTDLFLEPTSERFTEVGAGPNSDITGHFKRLNFTIAGSYDPTSNSNIYSSIQMQTLIDFVEGEVSSVIEHEGNIVASVNPINTDQSGKIYKIVETEKSVLAATENLDEFALKISSMSGSPDENITFISHSKGTSYFENFFLASFESQVKFGEGIYPEKYGWERTGTTPFPAASYTRDGLIIDTTFDNTSQEDTELLSSLNNVQSIRFSVHYSFLWNIYEIEITSSSLNLYLTGEGIPFFSTSLAGKTIAQLISELEALDSSATFYFGLFVDAVALNDVQNQQASNLDTLTRVAFTEISPGIWSVIFSTGNYYVVDPYNPDPYSKTSGGKWFYSQRRPGTPWFDKVDNSVGWSVDFDLTVSSIEDSDRPSNVPDPEGAGLYLNDGKYHETINFLTQEIVLGSNGKAFVVDNTSANRYRVMGKDDNLQVYVRRPNTLGYELLCESKMSSSATRQANGGRPAICEDDSGNAHVVWHDDGDGGRRQLFYSSYEVGHGWSEASMIVSDAFGASNPDIAIDSGGNIYVVFETLQSDFTDIGVIHKNDLGWSEPYLIASDVGDSFNPRLAIDSEDNVHVTWEDNRHVHSEIYYCRRRGDNGQWESSAFGFQDTRITSTAHGAVRPAIATLGRLIAIVWSAFRQDGSSNIYMAQHPGVGLGVISQSMIDQLGEEALRGMNFPYSDGSTNWMSSGQGGSDFLVSDTDSNRADFSDIGADSKGRFFVSWQEVVESVYQIKARIVGIRMTYARDIVTLTNALVDCRFPKVAVKKSDGFVYIVYERGEFGASDPYDPYLGFEENGQLNEEPSIRIVRWNAQYQVWESVTETKLVGSVTTGGFEVTITEGDNRQSRRPNVSPLLTGNYMHVIYEARMTSQSGVVQSPHESFSIIRDAIFDFTWASIYDLSAIDDPYIDFDVNLSGDLPRKEIRFGDFSNTMGVRYIVDQIRYYLNGAIAPFNIRFISPSTVNMPSVKVFQTVGNNRGDAWLGTDQGLIFFNSRKNSAFLFDETKFGIAGLSIYSISFDRDANMYLATSSGLYVSIDHAYFWKITGEVPSDPVSLETDSRNRLHVGALSGYYIIDTDFVASIKTTKENATSEKTVAATTVTKFDVTSGMPSSVCTTIKIDANDVAWVGTTKGLVRYAKGQISTFNMSNGLSSNKITGIAIKDTAVRFIATTAGVDHMTGVTIERLDFGNLTAPIVAIEDKKPDATIPTFNHVKAVHWRDPNVLFISTTHTIYQVEFVDNSFQSEKTKITRFASQDFSLTTVTPERNDDLQTFRIVGLEDITIPRTVLYEVLLNGKKITRGFRFSPDKQLLRFEYPLRENDIVQINVRFDVEILNDFKQNEAARLALGNQSTRIEKMISREGGIYAQTGGDINSIQLNDDESDLPFDRIILDTVPPVGKIDIGEQVDQTVFRIYIRKILENQEYLDYDVTSGIDKMIISNFPNFTTDGETPQNAIPFDVQSNHDIGVVFDSVTREYTFSSGKGRVIKRWLKLDGSQRMLAGTAFPANIYMFNPLTALWELKANLDDGNVLSEVNFIEIFEGRVIVGTGIEGGVGKIWSSTDGSAFTLIRSLPVGHAYCAEVLGGVLYIGAGGDEGRLYAYDGTTVTLVFEKISGAIYDLISVDGDLYAATGQEGRIYRLDPINSTQQILDSNADPNILSIGYAEVNTKKFIFAGTGSTASIRRSTLPDGPFIHSFKTINDPVYSMNLIGGKLWTAIGNTVFVLNNVWNAQYTHTEDIRDVAVGLGDVPWFVSERYIYKIGQVSNVKNVYLKMIDRAGNETSLYLNELQTILDPNLYDSITLEQLTQFTNQNRLLEVDEFGNTVFTYTDDSPFYSGNKLDKEVGSYFSEIFNGTNSIVSWDRISWDATIPNNTTMKVYVRVGTSRDEILDAPFNVVFDGDEDDGDISFLTGQYLQFKVVMTSTVRSLSPSLRSVVVRSIASQATHFFTTNFVLPSRVKSGIMTSTKMIPVAADIIFGIDTNNSTDFGDYQVVDENRIFTSDSSQVGKNLRVGIKLLTPSKGEVISQEFGEYGPYSTLLFFNAIDWSYSNSSGGDDVFQFRVNFYDSADFGLSSPIYQAYSGDDTAGFSDNGEIFQGTGAVIANGGTSSFSFVPVGETPIRCNTYYFVKVEARNSIGDWSTIFDNRSFIEACGTTFIDEIDFDFTNETTTMDYNFRIRFYDNPERTNLFLTAYSGNDQSGWTYENGTVFTSTGVSIPGGSTFSIGFAPILSQFETGKVYYLSIDAFNGTSFANNNNSFTFKARNLDSDIYCGPYVDVPVVKNFAVMFELEGNQFVTLKVN
jgi:hypothetical protein